MGTIARLRKARVGVMEQEIIVRGYGEARSMPDRAIVHVTIESKSRSRKAAYANAAEISAEVDRVVENRRDTIARETATGMVVQPTTKWEKGENIRTGWMAVRTSSLEVVGFDQLGELTAELATAGAAISGPRWELGPNNLAYREARRSASEDARHRAEDYASALGLGVDGVSWISEPGLRLSGDFGEPTRMRAAAMPSMAPSEDEEIIEVTPQEITAAATVEVAFKIQGT